MQLKQMNFLWEGIFGHLKGKLTLPMSAKHQKIAEQVFFDVLQHPTKFQEKILRGKKLWRFCIYAN